MLAMHNVAPHTISILQPSSASSSRSGEAKKWEMRLKQLVSTSVGVVERYDSPDPLAGFKMSVRRVLQLNPAVDIPVVSRMRAHV